MPYQTVPPVEHLRVDAVHMAHQPRQIGLPGVEHQVVVVAHQAIGQHLRVEPVHRLGDDIQLRQAVVVARCWRLNGQCRELAQSWHPISNLLLQPKSRCNRRVVRMVNPRPGLPIETGQIFRPYRPEDVIDGLNNVCVLKLGV
jgi:hypothetical protein